MAYHIYPINDYYEHKLKGTKCNCKPVVKFDENGERLIVHNSYDGRENRNLGGIEAYGKQTHKSYEGKDPAKSSTIYHIYINYTSKHNQPFDIDRVLDVRLAYQEKIKKFEMTGKHELDYSPEFCKIEIMGCDLLLKLLTEGKAY